MDHPALDPAFPAVVMSSSRPPTGKVDQAQEVFEDVTEKPPSVFDAEVESHRLTLRGKKLTAALAFVAGTGFTLFGSVIFIFMPCASHWIVHPSYDQGVMSALLTAPQVCFATYGAGAACLEVDSSTKSSRKSLLETISLPFTLHYKVSLSLSM